MKIFYILSLALLCGCTVDGERKLTTSNKEIKAQVVFTDEDGYTVKRFNDGNNYRYYVTPVGRVESIEQKGKTQRPDSIQTVK
jgi:hypothetical protein